MENTEKYKTFSISIENEIIKIDKDCNECVTTISCKTKFVDSAWFMATSLSNLFDNLTEETYKIKYKDCDCLLEYESVTDNSIKYECLSCNKYYSKKFERIEKEIWEYI